MRKRRRRVNPRGRDRKLTQEELLEEAKWTEIDNLASLEAYTRMEEERKKVKLKKKPWTGPVVRYLSLTMPVVTEKEGLAAGAGGGASDGLKSADMLPSSNFALAGVSENKEVRFLDSVNKDTSSQSMLSDAESASSTIPMDTSISNAVNTSPATGPPQVPPSGTYQDDGSEQSGTVPPTKPPLQAQESQPGSLSLEGQSSPQAQQSLKQSRNFLIFTDTNKYPSEYFPGVRPLKSKQRRLCPVTRLPAKYIDPLTRTPYATPFAFKVIRTRYVKEAEQKCEQRLQQLSSWLEEKKKKKRLVTA